jgi:glucose-6-phosphate-specific signal transduction histidine kinase
MTRRAIAYWLCQITGWGIYTAIGISIAASQVGWRTSLFVSYAIFFLVIVLLTHLLRAEIRRRQ